MKRRRSTEMQKHVPLERHIRKLQVMFLIPVAAMVFFTFAVLFSYVGQYSEILHNVTTASEFNQDFKEQIDLKMYYYVVESHYSDGLPIEEVKEAQELAKSLIDTTTQRESWKAINDVLNLCVNLESKIHMIEETDNYDERQSQLENNIYGLTSLIQEYMYTYLYHEASLLNSLQADMMERLYLEIGLIIVAAFILLLITFRRSLRLSRSITQPISNLCSRVQAIGEGNLTPQTPIQAREYEIQTLSDGFEQMVERLNQLIEASL